jgi:N-acetylgalactosamine kinase
MDQAISAMGAAGTASRIDFEPLAATPVALPMGASFVVSNCMEESAKAVDSEKRYNKRVTEGKLAAKIVAKGEGLANWKTVPTFRALQEALGLPSPGALLPAIERHLRPGAFSISDAAGALGMDPADVFEGDGKRPGALKVLGSVGRDEPAFELLKRARHVASEADRVFKFQEACEGKGGDIESTLKAMGQLMSSSHASCRDDYECSSEGLDALTTLATASGAYGSRLTGAGWGGCAVSLVASSKVDAFIESLVAGYYKPRGLEAAVPTAVFASSPGAGAAVYTPAASFDI